MTQTKLYAVANDLGYSTMKLAIKNADIPAPNHNYFNTEEIYPSVIAIQRPQNYNKPVVFNTEAEQDDYFANLQNHLDVTITSPTVDLQGRFLVGPRAIESGLPRRNFNVNDFSGKAESDLSVILTLSRLASQVVTDAYANHEDLTQILSANIIMTTNLPIKEGKKPGTVDAYAQRYLKGKHLVTLHNFDNPVTVELKFIDVYVGLEGEMGQFEIANAPKDLQEAIIQDFNESYPTYKDEVTAKDLIQSKNVLGIDIGEGTTDFTVIANGQANATASLSMSTGYGNVLEDAVGVLQSQSMNIPDRSALRHFLAEPAGLPMKKRRQDHAKEVVYDQLGQFVDEILDKTSEVMRHAGTDIEMVFVSGGGSIPLLKETDLRQRLVDELKGFAGGYDIPVIWITPDYAQIMNLSGLETYLKYMAKNRLAAHRRKGGDK